MAKKNNRKSTIKFSRGGGPVFYLIFIALIAAGAAMIYFLGFPFVSVENYYLIVTGAILIILGLFFLTAGVVPDPVTYFLAGFLLIAIGILHPLTLILAVCGVYLIIDQILILTGHQDISDRMGAKINAFFRKIFARKLEGNPEYLPQDARNQAMGIKKVKDMTNEKPQPIATQDEKTPAMTASIETQSTTGAMYETIETQNVIPEVPIIVEPDRAASEAMARPDAGQFITNFVAGFIFTVGGLMFSFSSLTFLFFSGSILEQLPFLLPGGIMLIIGIWQLIKGFKTLAKYSRKD